MALREQQVALTRQSIIDAFLALSLEPGAGAVTIAEVARSSGISQATIYRHFPNRDALLAAVAREQIGFNESYPKDETYLEAIRYHLSGLWNELAMNLQLAREWTFSEAGRELRRVRLAESRPLYQSPLVAAGIDPASPEGRRFVAASALLTSAHAFLDLADRQGLSVEESLDSVLWAVEVLGASLGLDLRSFLVAQVGPPEGAQPS